MPPALTSLERPSRLAAQRPSPGGSGHGQSLATSLASLSGFQPTPCGITRSPAGVPSKRTLAASLSRFLCPKAPVPPDFVGKWERHWLAPLPHASSFDRPANRLPAFILADVRRFRGGSDEQSSFRFRTILARHKWIMRLLPSRTKRNLHVDKKNNGDNFPANVA